jgi:hypothetical protein
MWTHKSLYLFPSGGLERPGRQDTAPKVYPYLVHCLGWPKPRHYHPSWPCTLRVIHRFTVGWSWRAWVSGTDKNTNDTFLQSQTQSSAFYLLAFARENELFGDYSVLELQSQDNRSGGISYFGASGFLDEGPSPGYPDTGDALAGKAGQVSYAQKDGYFYVRVDKPGKISSRFGILLYLFGYSKDTAFARMPKIRVIVTGKKIRVFNGKIRVADSGVAVEHGINSLALKIPLKLLGWPDYILTSMKAFRGSLPV